MWTLNRFIVPLKVVILSFFAIFIFVFQLITNFAMLEKIFQIFLSILLPV